MESSGQKVRKSGIKVTQATFVQMGYDAVFISKLRLLFLWTLPCSTGRRELLWGLLKAVKVSQQFSAVPAASCLVESRWRWSPEEAGDCGRSKGHHGTEAMGCRPTELAGVPGTATQLQCDTRGKLLHARYPAGDRDMATPCFLDAWRTLQSQSVLWGPEGLFLLWIDSLILFAEQAHKQLCVCVLWGGVIRCRAWVGRHGVWWQGGQAIEAGIAARAPEWLNCSRLAKRTERLQLHLGFVLWI